MRKDSNTLRESVDYNENLADMSAGAGTLSSFASITTGSLSSSDSDSDSDNDSSNSASNSEPDNTIPVSDDSE